MGGARVESVEVGTQKGTERDLTSGAGWGERGAARPSEAKRAAERGGVSRREGRGGEGRGGAERELTPLPRHQIASVTPLTLAEATARWRPSFSPLLRQRGNAPRGGWIEAVSRARAKGSL